MKHTLRGVAAMLATAAFVSVAFATSTAAADPLGGCPAGGGWVLIWSPDVSAEQPPLPWGPGAALVDGRGNNDGYACKTVFTNGAGDVIAQVIDNRVQAAS